MSQFRNLNIDVIINGENKRIDSKKRTAFVNFYELDKLIPNRYSEVLVVDLMINFELNGIDPKYIINEIKRLESIERDGYTKEASQFKHAPLYPLWHQHYFSEHFLVNNIHNEIKKNFNNIWDKSVGEKGTPIEQRHLDKLVYNLIDGTIETRSDEKRITGEWLIFSPKETGNIYLCMATHTTGDSIIYDKIAYCCERQFPSLEPFASNRKQQSSLVNHPIKN